jgi:3-oxoadipate enol-lactonase
MPMTSGYVEINGARLWYETAGDGDALLLMHAGICDASVWDEHMAPLSARFRVIRYDMRGFGRSNLPDGPFAAHDDARALLASLGVGRAHIVGVSMGGTGALNLALTYPDCVSALILVSTTVGGLMTQRHAELIVRRRGHFGPFGYGPATSAMSVEMPESALVGSNCAEC